MLSEDSLKCGRGRLVDTNHEISRNGGYDFVYSYDDTRNVIQIGVSFCHPHDYYNKRTGYALAENSWFRQPTQSVRYVEISGDFIVDYALYMASSFIDPSCVDENISIIDLKLDMINSFIHRHVWSIYMGRFSQYITPNFGGVKAVSYTKGF